MDGSDPSSGHGVYEEMAVEHVLGGLDEDQGRVFRAHLLDCPDCRARVGELRAIASDLAGVEQEERRERAAQAIETKRRDEQDAPPVSEPRRAWLPRVVAVIALVSLIALSGYLFVLRGMLAETERRLQQRLDASAALELGQELSGYTGPGIDAVVKVHDGQVVVLADGLEDAGTYGLYLVAEDGDETRTLLRRPVQVTGGRAFVLVTRPDEANRLLLVEQPDGVAADPDGVRMLDMALPPPRVTDSDRALRLVTAG